MAEDWKDGAERRLPPPVSLTELSRVLDETARLLRQHIAYLEAASLRARPSEKVKPATIRGILRIRRLRTLHIGIPPGDLGWELMLHLLLARLEGRQISQSRAAKVTGIADTTLLRIVSTLSDCGYVVRLPSPHHSRGVLLELSDEAAERLCAYLLEIQTTLP